MLNNVVILCLQMKKGSIQNSENNTMILVIVVGVIIAGIIGGVIFKLKKN